LKFRAASFKRKGLHPDKVAVFYGKGESMLPRIRPGDAILFDTADTKPVDGAIYVILWRGEYYAKRALLLDDSVYFTTDNPSGDHQWNKPKRMDAKRESIQVIGRVRWIGSWED
jgi:phage repressor protein C with HTH and peptisase S24 domain